MENRTPEELAKEAQEVKQEILSRIEAIEDEEGLQQMRTLARNMTFLMKSIKLGKETYGLPDREKGKYTNFIR